MSAIDDDRAELLEVVDRLRRCDQPPRYTQTASDDADPRALSVGIEERGSRRGARGQGRRPIVDRPPRSRPAERRRRQR
jgi:hypothetical protein